MRALCALEIKHSKESCKIKTGHHIADSNVTETLTSHKVVWWPAGNPVRFDSFPSPVVAVVLQAPKITDGSRYYKNRRRGKFSDRFCRRERSSLWHSFIDSASVSGVVLHSLALCLSSTSLAHAQPPKLLLLIDGSSNLRGLPVRVFKAAAYIGYRNLMS